MNVTSDKSLQNLFYITISFSGSLWQAINDIMDCAVIIRQLVGFATLSWVGPGILKTYRYMAKLTKNIMTELLGFSLIIKWRKIH